MAIRAPDGANNVDDIADIVDIIRIRNLMPRIMTLIREPPRLQ